MGTGIVRPELAARFGAGGYRRPRQRGAPSTPARLSPTRPTTPSTLRSRPATRVTSMRGSGSASTRPPEPLRWSIRSSPAAGWSDRRSCCRRFREGAALVEGFRGDVFVWLRLEPAGRRRATCAIRPGSNGRCWRRRSRGTSSPTSPSATNPSTAPTRGSTSDESMPSAPSRKPVGAAHRAAPEREGRWREFSQGVDRAAAGSAAASRSARSTPAPATPASWRSTPSPTPTTTSSASACASWPRRGTPTCCWSPARSRSTCARRWSAPMPPRPRRSGWRPPAAAP